MRLRLSFRTGAHRGHTLEFDPPRTLILGRSSQADIQIYDERISRRHCALRVDAQGGRVKDLGSGNGTFLNGVEVRESVQAEAVHALEEIIHSDAYGLVVVDEGLIRDPAKAAERAMRGRDLPVLLSVPSLGAAFGEGDDAVTYMKDLVRSAIGFDIKLE